VLLVTRHKRLGLIGSRERVEMVGGKFEITSKEGHGTTISAQIPIDTDDTLSTPKISRKSRRSG
jgi:signal transduction histidine kinase